MWLFLTAATQAIQLVLCRQFCKVDPHDINVEEWGRKIAASEFLMASSWAFLLYVSARSAGTMDHMFVVAVLVVVGAIRLSIANSFTPVVYAGLAPITFAIVLQAVVKNETVLWAIAMFAIASQLYGLRLAHNLQSTARSMLNYRAQKDALIAELEQANIASGDARKRAEQASAAKSHFLATMSHELRTPLNAILGFSEILKDELMGEHTVPNYKEYAQDIHRSGEHLLRLINQVLDHSRVEAGRFELRAAPIAIQDLGSDCASLLSLKASDGGIRIIEKHETDLPLLNADENAIRQIWLNLISNAIKFTPQGGKIVLGVGRTRTGGVHLSVRDTGPGIPQDEIPRVLSSFGQGSLSYETAQEGAGLGLPIVRGLVELHGGTFELRSAVGVGTECIAEFPASRVVHAPGHDRLAATA